MIILQDRGMIDVGMWLTDKKAFYEVVGVDRAGGTVVLREIEFDDEDQSVYHLAPPIEVTMKEAHNMIRC